MSCLFLKTYVRVCNKLKQKRNERINKCVKRCEMKEKKEKSLLTEGKFTVTQVVPVHHYDTRSSPVSPPTGAP